MNWHRHPIFKCALLSLGFGCVGCGARMVDDPPPIELYRADVRPGLYSSPADNALLATLDQSARESFATIHEARVFEGAAIGIAGHPSENVLALRRLLEHPQAAALFGELVETASMPGKLYGLCGLYFADSEAFETAVAVLAEDPTPVLAQFGCGGEQTTAAELVRDPREGRTMVEEGDTLSEWWAKHGSSSAVAFDIAGGGIPLAFAGNEARAPMPPL